MSDSPMLVKITEVIEKNGTRVFYVLRSRANHLYGTRYSVDQMKRRLLRDPSFVEQARAAKISRLDGSDQLSDLAG